jgi:hypothetical protein
MVAWPIGDLINKKNQERNVPELLNKRDEQKNNEFNFLV